MIYKDLIFNSRVFSSLSKAWKVNRLPHALIFHGSEGIGKEAHAIEFSALLVCQSNPEGRACGQCSNCIRVKSFQHGNVKIVVPMPAGNSSTKIEGGSIHSLSTTQLKSYMSALEEKGNNPYVKISLKANSIPIDIIRELRKDLYMSSIEDGWRIVMIFDAEKLCTGTQASANAILKILEEPPEKTLFILVTSYPDQLLDTIKSRCQSFYFSNPKDDEIKNYLISSGIEKSRCEIISKLSQGNIGLAMELNNNYDSIPKDIKIIFEAVFNDNSTFLHHFQTRLQELYRAGSKILFENFFQLMVIIIRDLILYRQECNSDKIVFPHLYEKYDNVIDENPKADFHSMLEAIDDAYRMHLGNVNLSLNALGLIFDIQSSLEGDDYKGISQFNL